MKSRIISRIIAMITLGIIVYEFSGTGCSTRVQNDNQTADQWINHSPRGLSERIYKEQYNFYARKCGEAEISYDKAIDISVFTSDSIWWPLFVTIDMQMPYEYKQACAKYGEPYIIRTVARFSDMAEYGIAWDDVDPIFVEILSQYITEQDSVWNIVICCWWINHHCYRLFYREMDPDSLRIISGEFYDTREFPC